MPRRAKNKLHLEDWLLEAIKTDPSKVIATPVLGALLLKKYGVETGCAMVCRSNCCQGQGYAQLLMSSPDTVQRFPTVIEAAALAAEDE